MVVDTGSSVDILFLDAYLKLGMSRAQIRPVATPLIDEVPYTIWDGRDTGKLEEGERVLSHHHEADKGTGGEGLHARRPEEPRDRNVCTLEIPEESSRKGRPHEEIQSIPFDERD
ncbi:hypothetical protein LIER_27512 [Lithospermum erythrorhizon]|uniref:Uncharacterized protein n=1 Tax=Lithospermum erythrorhizon TaxID=34254 RepID=A0AAV3RCL4_LITER